MEIRIGTPHFHCNLAPDFAVAGRPDPRPLPQRRHPPERLFPMQPHPKRAATGAGARASVPCNSQPCFMGSYPCLENPVFGYNICPLCFSGKWLMRISHFSSSCLARTVLATAWGVMCALVLAAPLLELHSCRTAGSILYLFFSCICHQIPERSFLISGYALAVCHRCSGIYIGMFLGSFLGYRTIQSSMKARRLLVLAAIIPILLDALAGIAGFWTGTAMIRFSTGLLFGTLISPLFVCAFTEFLNEAPWRKLPMQIPQFKGDLS